MSVPSGLGFMIWQLSKMPSPQVLADFVQYYGVEWLVIKLLDGPSLFNQPGGNDKILIDYIATLSAVCKVGMWQFCYGINPGPEGAAVGERFAKLEQHGLSFHFIDAEGFDWNKTGSGRKADLYLASLDIPARIPVFLNSYRYIKNFPAFPWEKFLKSPRVTGNAPQVYWEFAHNPADQLTESKKQYLELMSKLGLSKPFVPIGSTYFRGVPGDPKGWGPTVEDMEEFKGWMDTTNTRFYGTYSLDKILAYYDTHGWQWMKALTGKEKMGTTPPPPPPSGKTIIVRVAEVTPGAAKGLWVHSDKTVSVGTRIGNLTPGGRWYVEGNLEEVDGRIWAKIGEKAYVCVKDKDGTQYLKWI